MVETEMLFEFCSPQQAYERVMKKRAAPWPEADEDDPKEPGFEEADNPSDDEDREMFEDALNFLWASTRAN